MESIDCARAAWEAAPMTTLDDFAAGHEDAAHLLDAQRRQIAELEATVALLETENARLQADLGHAWFVGGERVRNGIVRWLRGLYAQEPHLCMDTEGLAERVANCEDIEAP